MCSSDAGMGVRSFACFASPVYAALECACHLENAMIRNVGGVEINPKHRASCHCGSVVLELDLPNGIVNPRRCDCSICRRKGTIVASVSLSGIKVLQGEASLKLYQFNTNTAKHY